VSLVHHTELQNFLIAPRSRLCYNVALRLSSVVVVCLYGMYCG